jgi:alpha-1,2-mannosyltransferase
MPESRLNLWSMKLDCDEVFNDWEALHYWLFGRGMQTWEYAPAYAIRTWAYILPHAFIVRTLQTLLTSNRIFLFYLTRGFLGLVSASVEALLITSIRTNLGLQTALLTLIFLCLSPGMFISATSLLPSAFAMYWVTAALAVGLFEPTRSRTWTMVFCVGVGSLLGWPFAGALALPFLLEAMCSFERLVWMVESGFLSILGISVGIFVLF